jgi:rRNA biogenesis protein RRP5
VLGLHFASLCSYIHVLIWNLRRRLCDRATSMNLSTKKMKFLFKKHLEYAKAMGDAKAVETVKAKARAYVEAKTAA